MRIAVLVLGILGVMGPAFVGLIWNSAIPQAKKDFEMMRTIASEFGGSKDAKVREKFQEIDRLFQTTYLLLAAIPLGLFGAVLGFLGRPLSAGLLMIVPALGPVLLGPDMKIKLVSLSFSALLLIGGVLAFFVRPPKPKPPREKVEDEEMEDDADEPPRSASRNPARGTEKITQKPARKPAARKKVEEPQGAVQAGRPGLVGYRSGRCRSGPCFRFDQAEAAQD